MNVCTSDAVNTDFNSSESADLTQVSHRLWKFLIHLPCCSWACRELGEAQEQIATEADEPCSAVLVWRLFMVYFYSYEQLKGSKEEI